MSAPTILRRGAIELAGVFETDSTGRVLWHSASYGGVTIAATLGESRESLLERLADAVYAQTGVVLAL